MSMYDMVDMTPDGADEGEALSEMFGVSHVTGSEREIETITEEILNYKRTAGESILEIGRRLKEAKALLSHGEWLPWLQEKVEFSERSAQNFMRLADAYQNPQTLADLGASKALVLLALSPVERDEFLEEAHTVNGEEKTAAEMSARELKDAIREKKLAEAERDRARQELERQTTQIEELKRQAAAAKDVKEAAEAEIKQAKDTALAAQERTAALKKELQDLRDKPVDVAVQTVDASPKQLAAARREAAEEARAEGKAALAKKTAELEKEKERLAGAQRAQKEAENRLQDSAAELNRLRSELERAKKNAAAMDNKALAEFAVLFRQTQEGLDRMTALLSEMDMESRGKMCRALDALAGRIAEAGGHGHEKQ